MKHTATLLIFALFCCTTSAQHEDWLPKGSILYYANLPWFFPPTIEIKEIHVIEAIETDSSQIRVMQGGCEGCESLDLDSAFLERIGSRVYYVTTSDSIRYLLYDFNAQIGDTVRHLGSLYNGEVEYGEYVVVGLDDIEVFDTVLTRRFIETSIAPYQYLYQIYDEFGAYDCLLPQYGLCDPGAGPLIAYRHPYKGLHCFVPEYCAPLLADFDYSPFPDLDERLYSDPHGAIFGIALDSTLVEEDVLTIIPNISVTDSIFSTCYSTTGGWMFKSVEIYPDGNTIFFNGNTEIQGMISGSDKILIKTGALVNEEWIAMTMGHPSDTIVFTARVVDEFPMEILGISDTVKRIEFTTSDTDAYDSLYVLIGKNSGLVNAPLFRQLGNPGAFYAYNAYNRQGNFRLVGKGLTGPGIHNLKWLQVWDFQLGDVLHIRRLQKANVSMPDYRQEKIGLEVLSKSFIPNGISYVFDRRILLEILAGNQLITELSRDTVTQDFVNNPSFDLLPGTYIGTHDGIEETYYTQRRFNDRDVKCQDESMRFYEFDSCINDVWIDDCAGCPEYVRGLGGGYYTCSGYEGDFYSYTLNYYKKGTEEWGTPFDFTVALEETSGYSSPRIEIYPNPGDDEIYVTCNGQPGRVSVYDIHGQLHSVTEITADNNRIDVSTLSSGMYFIKLNLGHTSVIYRVFIE